MTYILTADDIRLLTDTAGAMNAGRALLTPAARFGNIGIPAAADSSPTQNPSLKWSQADELNALALRASTSPPDNRLPVIGAGPNGEILALTIGGSANHFTYQPGLVYCFAIEGPVTQTGSGSASIEESGNGLYGFAAEYFVDRVPAPGSSDSLWTTYGKTSFNAVPIRGGYYLYAYSVKPAAITGLTDARLPGA